MSHNRIGENKYAETVQGNGRKYDVEINLEHPRSSSCNCPHANGKRIVCKHIVALYFAAFPKDAQRFYEDTVIVQEEEEKRQEKLENALIDHIFNMGKIELQEALLQVLLDGPEWQCEHFLREYIDEYWE
ncbi:MAG: SWIM zinc finger family protein [Clostridia bacterium]|nr:SWIM zinc finger family protein [Clostridia bacterium]